MEPLKCVENAVEAMNRKDVVMMKFWNDQYDFMMLSAKNKKIHKEAMLDNIKYRLSVRNPLTTPAFETRPTKIEIKRHIYRK